MRHPGIKKTTKAVCATTGRVEPFWGVGIPLFVVVGEWYGLRCLRSQDIEQSGQDARRPDMPAGHAERLGHELYRVGGEASLDALHRTWRHAQRGDETGPPQGRAERLIFFRQHDRQCPVGNAGIGWIG